MFMILILKKDIKQVYEKKIMIIILKKKIS